MNLFIVSFQQAIAYSWKEYAGQVLEEGDVFVLSPHELIVRLSVSDPDFLVRAFNIYEDAQSPVVGAIFKLNGTYGRLLQHGPLAVVGRNQRGRICPSLIPMAA